MSEYKILIYERIRSEPELVYMALIDYERQIDQKDAEISEWKRVASEQAKLHYEDCRQKDAEIAALNSRQAAAGRA